MRFTAVVFLASAALVGCGKDSGATINCSEFASAFTTEDSAGQVANSFATGEGITFHIQITNNNSSSQTLTPNTCPQVFLDVRDSASQLVWEYGNNVLMSCPPTHTYAAGEVGNIVVEWDQRRFNDNTQVPSGTYTAFMLDSTECSDQLDKSVEFEIQ